MAAAVTQVEGRDRLTGEAGGHALRISASAYKENSIIELDNDICQTVNYQDHIQIQKSMN